MGLDSPEKDRNRADPLRKRDPLEGLLSIYLLRQISEYLKIWFSRLNLR